MKARAATLTDDIAALMKALPVKKERQAEVPARAQVLARKIEAMSKWPNPHSTMRNKRAAIDELQCLEASAKRLRISVGRMSPDACAALARHSSPLVDLQYLWAILDEISRDKGAAAAAVTSLEKTPQLRKSAHKGRFIARLAVREFFELTGVAPSTSKRIGLGTFVHALLRLAKVGNKPEGILLWAVRAHRYFDDLWSGRIPIPKDISERRK